MKKNAMLAFLLAAVLVCTLFGCADNGQPEDSHAGHDHTTTTTEDAHAGHDHTTTTTEDAHAGHSHGTTATTAGDGAALTFDQVISMTLEHKIPADARVHRDATAGEPNYTLKLTAGTDLAQMQLISIHPGTSSPDKVLCTLPALKKGESQYILTYVNDAVANRGIVCVDTQGNRWYYAFLYSGQTGRVHLGHFYPVKK